MPMPKPVRNEDREHFIKRFMSDKTMIKDYPKQTQRYGVAVSVWNHRKK